MSLVKFKTHLNEARSKNPDLLQLVMFYRQLVVATKKGDDALVKKIKIIFYPTSTTSRNMDKFKFIFFTNGHYLFLSNL